MSLLSGVSYGGITYCMNLIPALAKTDKINEYHIFVQKGHPLSRLIHQDNFIFHEWSLSTSSAFIRLIWEQFIFPWKIKMMGIDIVFTAKNANILFAPCKTIISLRNMEPLCYRQYNNHWKLNLFSWLRGILTKISIKKADKIIAVSNSTKKYLELFSPSIRDKVKVIYNGNPVKTVVNQPISEETNPFLLSSSKFVAYANQLNLIKGYSLLCEKGINPPALWLAGGVLDVVYFEKIVSLIKEKELTDKIKILGFLPHNHLVELYLRAVAFVFPSTLEACPQTLIEAMACRVPIIASNVEPMPEICQDAAIYFDPFDTEDIAQKIKMLLEDYSLRDKLRKKSLVRSQFFSWEKTATELIRVFEEVKKSC